MTMNFSPSSHCTDGQTGSQTGVACYRAMPGLPSGSFTHFGFAHPLVPNWPGWKLSPGPRPRAREFPCLGDLSQPRNLWRLFSPPESPGPTWPSGSPWAGKAARQQIWARAWEKSKTLPVATNGLPCARARPGAASQLGGCDVTPASGAQQGKNGNQKLKNSQRPQD